MVHPTDFDDELASQIPWFCIGSVQSMIEGVCVGGQTEGIDVKFRYNVEKIEWITINGKEVTQNNVECCSCQAIPFSRTDSS